MRVPANQRGDVVGSLPAVRVGRFVKHFTKRRVAPKALVCLLSSRSLSVSGCFEHWGAGNLLWA